MYRATDFVKLAARPLASASQQVAPRALGGAMAAAQTSMRANAALQASHTASEAIAQRVSKLRLPAVAASTAAAAPTGFAAAAIAAAVVPVRVAALPAAAVASAAAAAAAPAAAVPAELTAGALDLPTASLLPSGLAASLRAIEVAEGRYELTAVPKKRVSIHKRRVRHEGHWASKLRFLYKPYKTCLQCKKVVAPHFACARIACLEAPRV